MKHRILFIVNPHSGTSSKVALKPLIERCIDTSVYDCSVIDTEYAGHATEIAASAAEDGVDIVVAVGGDGTVNEVARALIGTSAALGIVPCGSGNGLARHLLIPMAMDKALRIINENVVHSLDYGVIDGHPFFCTCGMGFDAFVSQKFAEAGKRGPVTYLEQILRQGFSYEPEVYELIDKSGSHRMKAFLISCANASQYGNNAYIAPQASMSDGLLDIIVMKPFDMIDAPQISLEMFNKTLDQNAYIKTFRTDHLHVRRSKEGVIHYDGDPVMSGKDIEIQVVREGIHVVVNSHADKRQRRPNAIQSAASYLINEINMVRTDVAKQGRHVLALSKVLQRKLSK